MGFGRDTGSHFFTVARLILAGVTIHWWGIAASAAEQPQATPPTQTAFSFETVRQMARALAGKEYQPQNNSDMPEFLRKMGYDEYQLIRFWPNAWPWHTGPIEFGIQCFHRGYIYQDAVKMHIVDGGQAQDYLFSTNEFGYGSVQLPKPLADNLHFAGFKVIDYPRTSIHRPEVLTILGASYFRPVGTHQRYGSSGRALAVDTGEPRGEEFPRFTEFWLEKPADFSDHMEFYALLDSASVAGAFRFVLKPGDTTFVDVEGSMFVRKEGKKLGLGALTSMFLFGKNKTRFMPDFRPEVHDCDGLLIQTAAGEWEWRPLVNPPKEHRITRFDADDVQGFGLMQRTRDYRDYADLVSRFELRPSLWIKPLNKWGPGTIELVEIPTPSEWNDNMVAYWVPKQKIAAGQELRWSYTISARMDEPERPPLMHVEATRISPEHDKNPTRFVVDFMGDTVPALEANATVEAKVKTTKGEIHNLVTERNEVTGGWRAFFDLAGAGSEPAELRMTLQASGRVLSETWVYHFQTP
jgi:glucans biosynthesis protein